MTQPVPPNQPPQPPGGQPVSGNPYADRPAPTGNPFAGQQPGTPSGNPFAGQGGIPYAPVPPQAPARGNAGLGLLVALGAAVVAAVLYGVIAGSIEREVGYAAVGVGFLIGFAASKVGGPLPVIGIGAAVVSVGAVLLGQLVGMAVIVADRQGIGFSEVFFDHFGDLFSAWRTTSDFMTYVFLALGPVGAFAGARKAG
ncbi:hypothetical protein ACFYY2_06240 [Streptomyces sp. NPDC001822]|uniref:hypothetical protein n=1 Tax=Streptomyces sp. NPDC001822 TaxID=3364614 RepID=UPI0036A29D76